MSMLTKLFWFVLSAVIPAILIVGFFYLLFTGKFLHACLTFLIGVPVIGVWLDNYEPLFKRHK